MSVCRLAMQICLKCLICLAGLLPEISSCESEGFKGAWKGVKRLGINRTGQFHGCEREEGTENNVSTLHCVRVSSLGKICPPQGSCKRTRGPPSLRRERGLWGDEWWARRLELFDFCALLGNTAWGRDLVFECFDSRAKKCHQVPAFVSETGKRLVNIDVLVGERFIKLDSKGQRLAVHLPSKHMMDAHQSPNPSICL